MFDYQPPGIFHKEVFSSNTYHRQCFPHWEIWVVFKLGMTLSVIGIRESSEAYFRETAFERDTVGGEKQGSTPTEAIHTTFSEEARWQAILGRFCDERFDLVHVIHYLFAKS